MRYQNFTSNEEYPVNYGTLELNNEGEPILVGAHNAYSLKTEGYYGRSIENIKILGEIIQKRKILGVMN